MNTFLINKIQKLKLSYLHLFIVFISLRSLNPYIYPSCCAHLKRSYCLKFNCDTHSMHYTLRDTLGQAYKYLNYKIKENKSKHFTNIPTKIMPQ